MSDMVHGAKWLLMTEEERRACLALAKVLNYLDTLED